MSGEELTGERLIELCKTGAVDELGRWSADMLFKPLTAFTDKNGWTPLHHAAFMNFAEVIRILLGHGADVMRQNSFGRTALHIAADWDNDEVARLLLEHASDKAAFLALTDESGRRASDYAVSDELKEVLVETTTVVAKGGAWPRRATTRKTTISKAVPDEFEVEQWEISTEERIGIGGTAEVFRGKYRGTEVAVKRMHFDGKSMPAHVEAFKREIYAMANCRHPNLVLLMGAVTRSLPLTLVTELCRGGSLYDLLYVAKPRLKLKLSRKQQLKMALDVARALNYLHTQKPAVVHRDCKSLNVLLLEPLQVATDVPVAKLADLGSAKQRQDSTMTANTGTYHWMAPEVLNGVQYDEKVDVYSFSMLLYEIFSGLVPFTEHEYLEPLQIAQAVQRGLRPGIEKVADFRVRELIEKCWRKDPSARPDMAAVIETLLALPCES